ncbi:MAG: tRNA (adenosine(37)-N6)-threonylcarbamoyltransferase complex ATPase subunit type 1 TsaE [Prevotellaceae bacterium]|jgi:tRNA threonylcarbamoyladenosine biosynthesis protein TsaE|nr:tRNA (adenosine(37)-N6)-threonylcarbamoyltransferase complex ATPase subunit type 1 TsaE [Prevotellaceae bacterium]
MYKNHQIISNSEEDTIRIAQKIAPQFGPGDVIILEGDLGAGKTYFVKGFTSAFHSKDLITSPTFSIANFYRTNKCNILHIDLYRITDIDQFNDLGLTDYFSQSIVLIEWGKKFASCFENYFLISFEINNDHTRTITFSEKL